MSVVSIPSETLRLEDQSKPRSVVYLPEEALQGENIPSHILWENAEAKYIQVFFSSPLKFKEIFNVEDYEIHENDIIVKKLELEGYVGLLFESEKIPDLELVVPVRYVLQLSNGDIVKKIRKIKLFRPQLEINTDKKRLQ